MDEVELGEEWGVFVEFDAEGLGGLALVDRGRRRGAMSNLFELVDIPGMVFVWPMPGEVC